ncbi:MAG: inositol monophosphatase family protein [Candidatus Rickettsia vulgarisii]
MSNLIEDLKGLIVEAGTIAIQRREAGLTVSYKKDESPVTNVDKEISDFIYNNLKLLEPNIPVVCEEREVGVLTDDNFWLVDPIDGTGCYMESYNTYTVNIALIKEGVPIIGLIYHPSLRRLYYTDDNNLLRIEQDGLEVNYDIASESYGGALISSRSLDSITQQVLETLPKDYSSYEVSLDSVDLNTRNFLEKHSITKATVVPSSIKLCLIAEGKFDIYPRFGETMGWDIAAGHALIKAGGGNVMDFKGNELVYRKNQYQNPDFYAYSRYWLSK